MTGGGREMFGMTIGERNAIGGQLGELKGSG